MIETTLDGPQLAPEQGSIQAQCFRPSGAFIEFRKDESDAG
jgi:hypothetical protein